MGVALSDAEPSEARAWKYLAAELVRRFNLGSWLSLFLPLLIGVTLVGACALLLLRRQDPSRAVVALVALSTVIVLAALASYLHQRRRFLSETDALVWLDERLGLHARLAAAAAGVGPWPERPADTSVAAVLRFRWRRILTPVLFCFTLLALAAWIPVSVVDTANPRPSVETPLAWSEMEETLEELREQAVIEEKAIEAWEERLSSLKDKQREEWYSHDSLEATDSLREQLESDLRALDAELERAEQSLEALERPETESSRGSRRLARRRLNQTLEQMAMGTMPLQQEMVRTLDVLARDSELSELSPEEAKALQERRERAYHQLRRSRKAIRIARAGRGLRERGGQRAGNGLRGNREGGSQSGGSTTGSGGISRGPGSSPVRLSDNRTELGSERIEDAGGTGSDDPAFGDTVGVSTREHQIDPEAFRGSQQAGDVSAMGTGGDLAWRNRLTPAERRILERFYK